MDAEPEAGVPVVLAVQDESFGSGNTAGSRLAIAQDNHSRSPSLNSCPPISQSGDRPAVPGGRRVETQELLGGRVEQRVALAADKPVALVGVLGQPLQGVRGQRGRGVEAAADDQPQRCREISVRGGRAVDLALISASTRPGRGLSRISMIAGQQADAHLQGHAR